MAVASNFAPVAKEIAQRFENETGHKVTLATGSTGQHYAQIVNGAPFDVFLAADDERPALLEQAGLAIMDSRFTYALGQLVLWSTKEGFASEENLSSESYRYLSIANPRLAPYGVAAIEFLQNKGIKDIVEPKLVLGENVTQSFQFVQSGSAQLGFVSLAQVLSWRESNAGYFWPIDPSWYSPIRQQAILLSDNTESREFMHFLQTETARQIIRAAGYELE